MADIKHLSIMEFQDMGLLQEVNRLWFHPRGLALSIAVPDDPEKPATLDGIWDSRDDPEGFMFDPSDPPVQSNATHAQELVDGKREARHKLFGSERGLKPVNIQPLSP